MSYIKPKKMLKSALKQRKEKGKEERRKGEERNEGKERGGRQANGGGKEEK